METNISYSGAHTESDDPLYSVIDDYSTHQYSQPPQLLLSGKVPYHQEIDRDGAEIAVADYEERPIKQNDSKQLKEGKRTLTIILVTAHFNFSHRFDA